MAHAVASRAPANKWVIASTVVLASFVVVMDVSIVTMMAYDDVFWMMGMLFVVGLPFLMMLGDVRYTLRQPAPQVPVGSNRA